jgi:hypothetical protein
MISDRQMKDQFWLKNVLIFGSEFLRLAPTAVPIVPAVGRRGKICFVVEPVLGPTWGLLAMTTIYGFITSAAK